MTETSFITYDLTRLGNAPIPKVPEYAYITEKPRAIGSRKYECAYGYIRNSIQAWVGGRALIPGGTSGLTAFGSGTFQELDPNDGIISALRRSSWRPGGCDLPRFEEQELMPIKHAFTSAKSDGADATLVRPSDWNAAHVIDGASFASIGARVWRSTNQSGPGTVSFDTEQWDTDGFWAVGNPTRLTVPAGHAGKYLIMGWFEGSNTGSLALRKNGSTNAVVAVNRTYACTIECVDNLVAGDYYELYELVATGRRTVQDSIPLLQSCLSTGPETARENVNT